MNKILYWGSALIIGFALGFTPVVRSVFAQEGTADKNEISTRITTPATSIDFMSRYKGRVDKTGALKGPWDVIVGTTDKAANSFKYSNVAFVFLGNGFVAFPSGTSTNGKPDYVISSDFTLYMKAGK